MNRRPRILHVISGLQVGGAEHMLTRLLERVGGRFEHAVLCLTESSPLGERITRRGIPVVSLQLRRDRPNLGGLVRGLRSVHGFRPDLIESWLYHSDLFAVVARALAPRARLVWNLRCSDMDLDRYAWSTRLLPTLLSRLSRVPDTVIVNSEAGRRAHVDQGYRPRRWALIPNGFDLGRLVADRAARERVRGELGVGPEEMLIGLAARFDPMKDHETFCAAVALVDAGLPLRFVLVGRGTEPSNAALRSVIERYGVAARIACMGERLDLTDLFSALDAVTLSSAFGEGFPNVIGEAMAFQLPCVTTDVGDAAEIVGDTGIVVARRNPRQLSEAWLRLLWLGAAERAALGRRARERIAAHYSLDGVVDRYETLYDELLRRPAAATRGGLPVVEPEAIERAPVARSATDAAVRRHLDG